MTGEAFVKPKSEAASRPTSADATAQLLAPARLLFTFDGMLLLFVLGLLPLTLICDVGAIEASFSTAFVEPLSPFLHFPGDFPSRPPDKDENIPEMRLRSASVRRSLFLVADTSSGW